MSDTAGAFSAEPGTDMKPLTTADAVMRFRAELIELGLPEREANVFSEHVLVALIKEDGLGVREVKSDA